MNSKTRSTQSITVFMMLALLFCFSAGPVAAAETIVIGHVTDTTGTSASEAPFFEAAITLALEEYNGMVAGKKIKVIHEDSGSNPTIAVDKARKLVEKDKAAIIIGPINAGAASPVSGYLGRSGIPHICMELPPPLFKKGGHTFAPQGIQPASGYIMGKFAAETLGHKTATVIHDDVIFAEGFLNGAIKAFEAAGGKIVQRQRTPMNTMDYGSYLSGMKKADAVFFWFIPPHSLRFIKSYHEYGFKMPLVLTGLNIMTDHLLHTLKDDAVGIYTVTYADAAVENPKVKEWVARWEKRFAGQKIISSPGMSMTCAWYIQTKFALEAIKATGGDTSPKALKKALYDMTLDTPWGPVSFADNGMGKGKSYILKVVKTGNKIHLKQQQENESRVRTLPK